MDANNSAYILLSNRDEVIDRPTKRAFEWPGTTIIGPQDIQGGMHGTWIGISKEGRFAVLLNHHEKKNGVEPISRGTLPREFLMSELPPSEWIAQAHLAHKSDLKQISGFKMLCTKLSVEGVTPFFLFSNRSDCTSIQEPTVVLSNGESNDSSWTKVAAAKSLFKNALKFEGEDLVKYLFEMFSRCTLPDDPHVEDMRNTIYLTPMKLPDGHMYGTRTQTLILVHLDGLVEYHERDLSGPPKTFRWKLNA